MSRVFFYSAVVVLALHGLIHLLGTTVYMKLGRVEGLAYKTTVLGGSLDLGEGGTALFGAMTGLKPRSHRSHCTIHIRERRPPT